MFLLQTIGSNPHLKWSFINDETFISVLKLVFEVNKQQKKPEFAGCQFVIVASGSMTVWTDERNCRVNKVIFDFEAEWEVSQQTTFF